MRDLFTQVYASLFVSILVTMIALVCYNLVVVKPHERLLEAQIQVLKKFDQLNSDRLDKHADTLNLQASILDQQRTALAQLGETIDATAESTNSLSETVNYNAEIANYNASLSHGY